MAEPLRAATARRPVRGRAGPHLRNLLSDLQALRKALPKLHVHGVLTAFGKTLPSRLTRAAPVMVKMLSPQPPPPACVRWSCSTSGHHPL
jgi:hypothetical protein